MPTHQPASYDGIRVLYFPCVRSLFLLATGNSHVFVQLLDIPNAFLLPPNYTKKTLLEILRSKVPQRAGCAVSEPKVFAWPFLLGGNRSTWPHSRWFLPKVTEAIINMGRWNMMKVWPLWNWHLNQFEPSGGKYSCIHLPASMHVVIHVFYYALYNIHYIQIYIYIHRYCQMDIAWVLPPPSVISAALFWGKIDGVRTPYWGLSFPSWRLEGN